MWYGLAGTCSNKREQGTGQSERRRPLRFHLRSADNQGPGFSGHTTMAAAKSTKYCELNVTLLNGTRIAGRFHIEARTTSTVRPSDAIRENKDRFILLTDATSQEGDESRGIGTLMIAPAAIAFVELPDTRWTTPPLIRPEPDSTTVTPALG